MRRRLRLHLTYANVMVTILAFIVLGGGTALASLVITSNSQVASNTISGHQPPTGKHSNIIGGSVNGTDLSSNSVNSSKVTNGSLLGSDLHANTITGANLNATSVAGALQVRTGYARINSGDAPVDFYKQGPWTLTGSCFPTGLGIQARADLTASAPAFISLDDAAGQRLDMNGLFTVSSTGFATAPNTSSQGDHFSVALADANFSNHLSGHVLAIADANSSDGTTPFCKFGFEGVGQ